MEEPNSHVFSSLRGGSRLAAMLRDSRRFKSLNPANGQPLNAEAAIKFRQKETQSVISMMRYHGVGIMARTRNCL